MFIGATLTATVVRIFKSSVLTGTWFMLELGIFVRHMRYGVLNITLESVK